MKKLTLTIVCAMAMSGAAFSQGFITWSLPSANITMQTNSTVYSPLFGGGTTGSGAIGLTATTAGGFDYILLYANGAGVTDSTVWDGTWLANAAFDGGTPGELDGTNGISALQKGAVLPENTANGQSGNGVQVNWANGTTNSIVLVGWSANLGSSWGAVSNLLNNWSTLGSTVVGKAYFGESAFGYINPSAGTPGTPIAAGGPDANGLPLTSLNTPLYLLPVPEPATLALAGLGGLSILLFRRRKS